MQEIVFERARPGQIPEIFDLYRAATQALQEAGIDQWDEVYPGIKEVTEDVTRGELIVGRVGGVAAAACVVNEECGEQYKNGRWRDPGEPHRIVHRLCVNPAFQGRGIARAVMGYLEDELSGQGVTSIRLDAFPQNLPAICLYTGLGYRVVGEIELRKGMFYLMEKNI